MILAKENILHLQSVLDLGVQDALYYLSYVVKTNRERIAQQKKMKN